MRANLALGRPLSTCWGTGVPDEAAVPLEGRVPEGRTCLGTSKPAHSYLREGGTQGGRKRKANSTQRARASSCSQRTNDIFCLICNLQVP